MWFLRNGRGCVPSTLGRNSEHSVKWTWGLSQFGAGSEVRGEETRRARPQSDCTHICYYSRQNLKPVNVDTPVEHASPTGLPFPPLP